MDFLRVIHSNFCMGKMYGNLLYGNFCMGALHSNFCMVKILVIFAWIT